jgi:ATP-binding protein involved in chromosome partitioning
VKHVLVMSGKGGVGKTTVATNLAAALKEMGYKVGLLDADLYGPASHHLLGLPTEPLQEDMSERKLIPPVIRGVQYFSMSYVVPAEEAKAIGLNLPAEKVRDIIITLVKNVKWVADYLVIDTPPGSLDINLKLLELLPRSGIVYVMEPHPMSLENIKRLVNVAGLYDVVGLAAVVNKVNLFPAKFRSMVLDYLDRLGVEVIEIPWDEDLIEGVHPEKEYFKRLAEVVASWRR